MSDLFNREIEINAGGLRIANRSLTGESKPILRVVFKIEKTLQKDPNTAELTIYNLSKESRVALGEQDPNTIALRNIVTTTILAGYYGNADLIFTGDLEYGASNREGTEWVTTLQSADGGRQFRSARINLSFDSGTLLNDVLKTGAEALGVGLGNITTELAKGAPRSSAQQYVKGLVLSGQASTELDKIIKRAGFNWSIQDGQIQLIRPGGVLNPNEAILLQQGTGLIGVPELGDKGVIMARSLLQPDLTPGKKVQIRSGLRSNGQYDLDAFFRVDKSVITGDTWGTDWYTDIEASPV
jgi:hypothetical protein